MESRPQAATYVVVGAVCGLTWATGFRGWMVQLVWPDSEFTSLTFVLVLAPGLAVGMLLGWSAHLRAVGRRGPRWLVFSPVIFAVALLDPEIFAALIENGEGSGALIVVVTALAVGFVLSRMTWSAARVACAFVALAGLLMVGAIGTMAGPLTSARGAWVSLFGLSFVLLLGLASVLPYRPLRPPPGVWSYVALGALCGFAWSSALRGFMAEVAGRDSDVQWVLTWGFILLPGVLVGALLGWAEFLRRTGGRPGWRRLSLAPLLFAAILFSNPLDLLGVFEDGLGAGAVALPVICMLGGHAVSGCGPVWTRLLGALVFVAALTVWALTATAVGGPTFSLTTPHGLWATLLYYGLLVTFALGASVPQRTPVHPGHRTGRTNPSRTVVASRSTAASRSRVRGDVDQPGSSRPPH